MNTTDDLNSRARFIAVFLCILLAMTLDLSNNFVARLGLPNVGIITFFLTILISLAIYLKSTIQIVSVVFLAIAANIPGLGLADPDILAAMFLTALILPYVYDYLIY